MKILEIAAKLSGFRSQFCKRSLMKVHYPKSYNMAHLLALNALLLPKDLTFSWLVPELLVCYLVHRGKLVFFVFASDFQ